MVGLAGNCWQSGFVVVLGRDNKPAQARQGALHTLAP
jgi:hypothetical protein